MKSSKTVWNSPYRKKYDTTIYSVCNALQTVWNGPYRNIVILLYSERGGLQAVWHVPYIEDIIMVHGTIKCMWYFASGMEWSIQKILWYCCVVHIMRYKRYVMIHIADTCIMILLYCVTCVFSALQAVWNIPYRKYCNTMQCFTSGME